MALGHQRCRSTALKHQSRDLKYQSRDLKYQSQDLKYQSQDLKYQSQDLASSHPHILLQCSPLFEYQKIK